MTILASTREHLVEYDDGMLTIARRTDGHCIALTGRGIAGQFRECLRKHPAERVVALFLRMVPTAQWQPLLQAGLCDGLTLAGTRKRREHLKMHITVVPSKLSDGSKVFDVRLADGGSVMWFKAVTEEDATTFAAKLSDLINTHTVTYCSVLAA